MMVKHPTHSIVLNLAQPNAMVNRTAIFTFDKIGRYVDFRHYQNLNDTKTIVQKYIFNIILITALNKSLKTVSRRGEKRWYRDEIDWNIN